MFWGFIYLYKPQPKQRKIYKRLDYNMVIVEDDEIERIIPVVRLNCAMSGGCCVYKNGTKLACVMGDEEICWVT